ncbi:MAG: CCA tRNA nucleotidyltransferase, partial [Pseudomonadota bacterium]
PHDLAAVAALKSGIAALARERVGAEMKKLLLAPDPTVALRIMGETGVLAATIEGLDPSRLGPLVEAERSAGLAPDWQRRLMAMAGLTFGKIGRSLRLSNAEKAALQRIEQAVALTLPEAAYRHGVEAAESACLLTTGALSPESRAEIAGAAAQTLPITAQDLMTAGLKPGPALGKALASAEQHWIEHNFSFDKPALVAKVLAETGQPD